MLWLILIAVFFVLASAVDALRTTHPAHFSARDGQSLSPKDGMVKLKYAIDQISIEFKNWKEYNR